jgi:hypothetical protein
MKDPIVDPKAPTAPPVAPPPVVDPPQGVPPGTQPAPPVTLTQAEHDKAVTQALQTREANLRKEYEEKALVGDQKYKELYERQQAETAKRSLETQTAKELAALGMSNLTEALQSDTSTLEGRVNFAKSVKKEVDTEVARQVAAKINTAPAPDPTKGPGEKSVLDMDQDEYEKNRENL